MADTVALVGIGELITHDPDHGAPLGLLRDAAVVVDGGVVAWTGPASRVPAADTRIDVAGAAVLPGFVDSHTHLVFAGDRAAEFDARMAGEPYTAGGIRSTVAATRAASDDDLRRNASRLAAELLRSGVTTFEVKSGYGLTVADEERCLKVARDLTAETTFLGAHVVPPEYVDEPDAYVDLVTGPMLTACSPHAHWIDVFCERGAFDGDQARTILLAGQAAGLGLRLHANQLQEGPGVQLGVALGAASVDHCTHLSEADVEALAGGTTVATLVPGAEFSTRSTYADARRLLDVGATVALATDCNPGTSFTTSMAFCLALAVRDLRMTPAEALTAATVGGAKALRRDHVGTLMVGARADLVVLDAPSYVHLMYRPGVDLVREVWRAGTRVHDRRAA